jgi:hypothetical protein
VGIGVLASGIGLRLAWDCCGGGVPNRDVLGSVVTECAGE